MKRYLILLMLTFVALVSIGASPRNGLIPTGWTMMRPISLGVSDTICADDTVVFNIINEQKCAQMQYFTVGLTQVTVTPSVTITAYGKVTSSGAWVQIGSPITWTTVADNGTISSTAPINYNYLKVEFIGSSASQKSKITTFEVKCSNAFEIPSSAGTITFARPTTGVVTLTSKDDDANAGLTIDPGGTGALILGGSTGTTAITSSDWTIGATGAMAGIGNIASNGSLILSGATSGGITITPIATGTAATTIQNQNVAAATITLPSATCTLPGLGLANTFSAANAFTGGVTIATQPTSYWAASGSINVATTGTDVACANGARWWVELDIPYNSTITGLAYLVGSVGGTDSVVVQLLNSAGVEVATSRAVGSPAALVGTAAQFQSVAFTAPYAAVAGRYFACLQFNGTTAKFRAYPIPGARFIANTTTGTWGTAANPSVGTTYVADKAPFVMTY